MYEVVTQVVFIIHTVAHKHIMNTINQSPSAKVDTDIRPKTCLPLCYLKFLLIQEAICSYNKLFVKCYKLISYCFELSNTFGKPRMELGVTNFTCYI